MEALDETRKESIREALYNYREAVLELNLKTIRDLYNRNYAYRGRSRESFPTKEAFEKEELSHFLGIWVCDVGEMSLHDILDPPSTRHLMKEPYRSRLIEVCLLDGVGAGPVQPDKRALWFSHIGKAIQDLPLHGPRRPSCLPSDLTYLSTLIESVHGPGFGLWRDHHSVDFLSSIAITGIGEGDTKARVQIPSDKPDRRTNFFTGYGGSWDISVAVKIGDDRLTNRASYVVFCRRSKADVERYQPEPFAGKREEDEWKLGDDIWRWRYGIRCPCRAGHFWASNMHDTVEEHLQWYTHFEDFSDDVYYRRMYP